MKDVLTDATTLANPEKGFTTVVEAVNRLRNQ
jgi:hypothetical protein